MTFTVHPLIHTLVQRRRGAGRWNRRLLANLVNGTRPDGGRALVYDLGPRLEPTVTNAQKLQLGLTVKAKPGIRQHAAGGHGGVAYGLLVQRPQTERPGVLASIDEPAGLAAYRRRREEGVRIQRPEFQRVNAAFFSR